MFKLDPTQYESVFKSIYDVVMILKGDYFIDCSDEALKQMNCSKEDIVGTTPWTMSPEYQRNGRRSDESAREIIRKTLEGEKQLFEWQHVDSEGNILDVEISMSCVDREAEITVAIWRSIVKRLHAKEMIEKNREDLKSYEKQNEILFKRSPYSMAIADFEKKMILDINENYMVKLKYSRKDMCGIPGKLGSTLVDTVRTAEILEKYRVNKVLNNEEVALKAKDGEIFYFLVFAEPIVFQGIEAVLITLSDISAQKKTEFRLKESEEKFRHIFNSAKDGIVILDNKGNIIDANHEAARMYGYSIEEFRSKNISQLISADNPDGFERIIGKIGDIGQFSSEVKSQHRAQWPLIVELNGSPVYINEQKCYLAVIRDITERKQAEEAMKKSEEKYRLLVNNLPGVVWSSDEKGITKYISPKVKDIYGYTALEIYQSGPELWFGRVHPEDKEGLISAYGCLFKKGKALDTEYRIQRKDGKYIWLHDRSFDSYVRDGVNVASGIFFDITDKKETQNALIESEARFRSMSEQSLMGIVIIQDFHIRYINQTFADFWGYPVHEVLNWSADEAFQHIHIDDRKLIKDQIQLKINKDQPIVSSYILRIIDSSNRLVHLEVHSKHFVYRGKGAVFAMVINISEKLKALEEKEQSELRFQQLVENMNDGFIIIDLQGRIEFVNYRLCEITGYEREEVLGQDLMSFFDEKNRKILSDQMIKRKQGNLEPYEISWINKEGFLRNTLISPAITYDKQGSMIGSFAVVTDITEIRKIQHSYQTLFAEMLDGFALHKIILDEKEIPVDYSYVSFNPAYATLTGLDSSVIGKTIKSIHPDTDDFWIKTFGEVAISGRPKHFEHFDKALKKFLEIKAFSPGPGQFAAIFSDITDRKMAETKLLEQEKMLLRSQRLSSLGNLASAIAHEIRQPLNLIKIVSETFLYLKDAQKKDILENIDLFKKMEQISGSVSRIDNIIHNLQNMVKNPNKIEKGKFQINDLISELLDLTKQKIKNHQIKFELDMDENLPLIELSSIQFQQVILNLVSNAIDALDECEGSNKKIELITTQDRKTVFVIVKDNGPGIEEAIVEKIFDPMFSTKIGTESMGLGLFIVNTIIVSMNGRIKVESTPGLGAKFVIGIPK